MNPPCSTGGEARGSRRRRGPRRGGSEARRGPAAARGAREGQRSAALAKANRRREEIAALKSDARLGRVSARDLIDDRRAQAVKALTVIRMLPGLSLYGALEVLLECGVNGARPCSGLSTAERRAIARALGEGGRPAGAGRRAVIELGPSEFAAARQGLGGDPRLQEMVERLVGALRLYVEEDDGGVRARVVLEQWIRYRNYRVGPPGAPR